MDIKFASYNIHKAVGTDRRRDPLRTLAVLNELDADIIALQEVDRRFGERESVLCESAIRDKTAYRLIPLATRPASIGWHGNAFLVRRGFELDGASIVDLPVIEPRGAIRADIIAGGCKFRVVGMHLDLSGLRRRGQIRRVLSHIADCEDNDTDNCPAVIMGDTNEWARKGGAFKEFDQSWRVLAPGRSFPARRPLGELDRIIASNEWQVLNSGVHHSSLAAVASDHLPVTATLRLAERWHGFMRPAPALANPVRMATAA